MGKEGYLLGEESYKDLKLVEEAVVFRIAEVGYLDDFQQTGVPKETLPVLEEMQRLRFTDDSPLTGGLSDAIKLLVYVAYLTGLKDGISYAEEGKSGDGFVGNIVDDYVRRKDSDWGGLIVDATKEVNDISIGIPRGKIII